MTIKLNKPSAWLLTMVLTALSYGLSKSQVLLSLNISPLIIAIMLGMVVGNLFKQTVFTLTQTHVIAISTKQILRLGIILYGFKITFTDIALVGWAGVLLACFVVFSTFFLALYVGKWLGLDRESAILIGSGSAICGAAAVLATQSSIQAKAENAAVAVCTVVVFGTFSMLVYPLLYSSGVLGLDAAQMGLLMGASLHEVAHAVAAGAAVGSGAADITVMVKMLRVAMLVPFLLMLGVFFSQTKAQKNIKNAIPYFALWFVVAVFIASMLPEKLYNNIAPYIATIDTLLLTQAMLALGLSIRKEVLTHAGKKPFMLAFVLLLWLFLSVYAWVKWVI